MSGSDSKRRHRSQMTPAEIASVERFVHNKILWTIGPHATAKMRSKGVTDKQVFDTLDSGYVVEVNQVNDLCAVFRKELGRYAVCVVVNLPTRFVVSVWKNGALDQHATLDHSKYQWHNVNLQQVMEAFV